MGLAVSALYCCTLSRTNSTNQESYASPSSPLSPSHVHLTTSALNLSDWLEHASIVINSPPFPFSSVPLVPAHTLPYFLCASSRCEHLLSNITHSRCWNRYPGFLRNYDTEWTQTHRSVCSHPLSTRPKLHSSGLLVSPPPLLPPASCLTPCVDQSSPSIAACNVIRGVPASYKLFDSGSTQHTSYDSFTSLSDFLSNQFGCRYAGCTSFSFVANSPLSLRDPFPQMFTPDITPFGLIHSVSREELAESGASAMVKSILVGTSIENNSGLYSLLSSCANLFEQRTHLHLFSIRQNIERDLMEESKHSLLSLLDRYPVPVEMQSPSDSDSD